MTAQDSPTAAASYHRPSEALGNPIPVQQGMVIIIIIRMIIIIIFFVIISIIIFFISSSRMITMVVEVVAVVVVSLIIYRGADLYEAPKTEAELLGFQQNLVNSIKP